MTVPLEQHALRHTHMSKTTSFYTCIGMYVYALGILPLIKQLDHIARQVWFANDASAGGKLAQLRAWWDLVVALGPGYGYFANPSKTWLIVKPKHLHVLCH